MMAGDLNGQRKNAVFSNRRRLSPLLDEEPPGQNAQPKKLFRLPKRLRKRPPHYNPLEDDESPTHPNDPSCPHTTTTQIGQSKSRRWTFRGLKETSEETHKKQSQARRIKRYYQKLKAKEKAFRARRKLRKRARKTEVKIEEEAWENTKVELFILFLHLAITGLVGFSAFNKFIIVHEMTSWWPQWIQFADAAYELLSLGILWEEEWLGLNFLNGASGFWTFVIFVAHPPAKYFNHTGTLFERKGFIGIAPWMFVQAALMFIILYRGYTKWLNASSMTAGFLWAAFLWVALGYDDQ